MVSEKHSLQLLIIAGAHSHIEKHVLHEVPQAPDPQGLPVQERQGLNHRSRQASLRLQTEGLRRTDQACVQKEGENHEEGYPQA